MEYSLGDISKDIIYVNQKVLILVLVEDSLGVPAKQRKCPIALQVLILVLVEDSLGDYMLLRNLM